MFTNISWKEFALTIAAALFLYYIWLFFIFYAKDILRLFKHKEVPVQNPLLNDSDEIFNVVYGLQDEIKDIISAATAKGYAKPEIFLSLKRVLEKYALAGTPFQFALNNFIEQQFQNIGSIPLDEGDLKHLWVS